MNELRDIAADWLRNPSLTRASLAGVPEPEKSEKKEAPAGGSLPASRLPVLN